MTLFPVPPEVCVRRKVTMSNNPRLHIKTVTNPGAFSLYKCNMDSGMDEVTFSTTISVGISQDHVDIVRFGPEIPFPDAGILFLGINRLAGGIDIACKSLVKQ